LRGRPVLGGAEYGPDERHREHSRRHARDREARAGRQAPGQVLRDRCGEREGRRIRQVRRPGAPECQGQGGRGQEADAGRQAQAAVGDRRGRSPRCPLGDRHSALWSGRMLEIDGITKTFGSLTANDRISFRVEPGTVHALLGENGAGKSTLMNVLYGLYRPDAGRILLRGRPVTFHSPRDAIRAGIGMIHQHFMLVPPLSVSENIVLGYDPLTQPWLNLRRVEREVYALSAAYGLDVDPRAIVWQLPVGQQQRVEILKALYRKADLLI